MLYSLLRPVLFSLDPERAHRAGIMAAHFLSQRAALAKFVHEHLAKPISIPVSVAGLNFPNPIGLAAGLDKNAQAPLGWWAMGFGFVEVGTVTPLPQAGKPKPRLFRFPQNRSLVNRMGFNNDGADVIAERLASQAAGGVRPPIPIGVSIGKNAFTLPEQAIEDYAIAAAKLGPQADYLAINISSPNTPGLRDLQSRVEVMRLIRAVKAAAGSKPIFVKLAPELSGDGLSEVLDACAEAGAAGIIATNTLATLGQNGLPEGGLSGRPLREISLRQVGLVRKHVGSRLAVIGCGGIEDLASAQAMFDAGADLIQIYTALVYQGPFLPARLTRELAGIDVHDAEQSC